MSETLPAGAPAPKKSRVAGVLGIMKDAWRHEALDDRTPRGRLMALIRVIGTTVKGVVHNKIPLQAAGLTYYTLMSIGPMLALAVILAGFILHQQKNGQELLKTQITAVIRQVAPQTALQAPAAKSVAKPDQASPSASPVAPAEKNEARLSPELEQLVDNLVKACGGEPEPQTGDVASPEEAHHAKSAAVKGGASVAGLLILVFLAVMMLARIENAFNTIWNVHKGRPWKDRFINYFLFMVVSCLIGAASLTMFAGSGLAKSLEDNMASLPGWLLDVIHRVPFLWSFLTGYGPGVISLLLVTLLAALFNKFMPNARVKWRSAIVGGFAVALLFLGYQKLQFVFAGNVAKFDKLYGSLSIIVVLMFGMYFSWLLLLIGGQFTFSLQNSRALAAYNTWESLSARTKQTLCFGCLLLIGRRFRAMETAPDSEEMAAMLRVPRSITDQCLARLMELKLVVAVDDGDDNPDNDRYRPDFPLGALTIARIKDRLESYNANITIDPKVHTDSGLALFDATYARFAEIDDARLTFEELIVRTESKA